MVREVGRDDLLENGLQFRFQLIDAPGRRPECVVPPAHRLLDVRQDLATDVRIIVLLQQGDQDKAVDADAAGDCRIDLDELPRRDVVVPLWFANSLDVGKRRVGVPDEDDEIGAIVPDLVGLDHAAEFTQHESCHGRSLLAQRPTFLSGLAYGSSRGQGAYRMTVDTAHDGADERTTFTWWSGLSPPCGSGRGQSPPRDR